MRERVSVIQSKTKKPVQFELTENTRDSVIEWVRSPEMIGCRFLFPSRFHDRPHISTRQYGRSVRDWVIAIGPAKRPTNHPSDCRDVPNNCGWSDSCIAQPTARTYGLLDNDGLWVSRCDCRVRTCDDSRAVTDGILSGDTAKILHDSMGSIRHDGSRSTCWLLAFWTQKC